MTTPQKLPEIKVKPVEKFRIERDVKNEIKRITGTYRQYLYRTHGLKLWEFMPVSNGMGKHGVPDFNFCIFGRYVAIEAKYGDNRPTPRQTACLNEIELSGGIVMIINETNFNELIDCIERLYSAFLRTQNYE